ncbi:MAG: nicotinamide riboside transporter PnuC [Bacteroidales bacterium]
MNNLIPWITEHWLEIFGALAGIVYVLLEIRQNIWLWPVGIVTSSVYIIVFFTSKFYADMSLQVYYLVISFYGWYAWSYGTLNQDRRHKGELTTEGSNPVPGTRYPVPLTRNQNRDRREPGELTTEGSKPETRTETGESRASSRPKGVNQKPETLIVTPTPLRLVVKLAGVYIILHAAMWYILANHTDSPVAGWDSFTTALSVIATWMLARKYIEHWILWIIVNIISMILYIYKGLYPTTVLFFVYALMAIVGYREWSRDMKSNERIRIMTR